MQESVEIIKTELEERLRFEELLSNISSRFVNIPPDRVDPEINHSLKQILEFFQIDRVGLLQGASKQRGPCQEHGSFLFADVSAAGLEARIPPTEQGGKTVQDVPRQESGGR